MVKTRNLYLAAFLLAHGHELTKVERNGEDHAYFLIDAHETTEHHFWGPRDLVSAKRFVESWKYLRRLLDAGVRR